MLVFGLIMIMLWVLLVGSWKCLFGLMKMFSVVFFFVLVI